MDDKLPQVTATHKDSGDYAEQVESHVSTAAHTGKKSHLLNYLVVQKSSWLCVYVCISGQTFLD